MNAASVFRTLGSYFSSARPRHRPKRPRLLLERLEDRVVPDATGFNALGSTNNATFQFGPSSAFVVVSALNVGGLADAQNLLQATASFSVNSLGSGNPFVPPFATGAFGFGSGTQPGAPWAPAAYNVGLANQQLGYPSISDMGFQATPPWARNIAHHNRGEHRPAADDANEPDPQALTAVAPEEGEDGSILREDEGPEQTTADPTTADVPELAPGIRRGDADVEEALFADLLRGQRPMANDDTASAAALVSLGQNPLWATLEGTCEEWATAHERLTESPLLLAAVLGLVCVPVHSPAEEEARLEAKARRKRARD